MYKNISLKIPNSYDKADQNNEHKIFNLLQLMIKL